MYLTNKQCTGFAGAAPFNQSHRALRCAARVQLATFYFLCFLDLFRFFVAREPSSLRRAPAAFHHSPATFISPDFWSTVVVAEHHTEHKKNDGE